MDLRQTKEFAQYLKLRGWRVEKIAQDFVFIRPLPLIPFSIVKIQRPKKINFKKIDRLAKKNRALSVYLEPKADLKISLSEFKKHGYRPGQSPNLPTRTIWLNLKPAKTKIYAQMKKDTRYSIRKAQKENLQLLEMIDLEKFRQAWKKANGLKKHVPSLKTLKALKNGFGPKAVFLTAVGKKIIAGTVILITPERAYYYYAFTAKKGRQKLAQYLLVWEAIKLAKKKKCLVFDLEGIYDKRFPIKAWRGFSHFKKSFGGQETKYPGFFVKKQFPF